MKKDYQKIAREKTFKHIQQVRFLLQCFSNQLRIRGDVHDHSKMKPFEMHYLAKIEQEIDENGQAPFGSYEYKRRSTEILGPMLKHHYENNSHHPEHYENGVSGMCLLDVMEMLADWKAASERGEETSINLEKALERFGIEGQLASVLRNTCEKQGWK